MKPIIVSESFPKEINLVWKIISDLKRCDWVPGVKNITLERKIRSFTMEGMGRIKEKIIICDTKTKVLQYSAIQTSIPIKHHLATIKLAEIKNGTLLKWVTEIEPFEFGIFIEKNMLKSLTQLRIVLAEI